MAVGLDAQVARLEVTVDDAFSVCGFQPIRQLHAPLERAFNDESTQMTAAVPLANSFVYDSQDPCNHPVVWKDGLLGKMITLNFHEMGPVARYTTFVSLPNAVPAVDFYHPISSLNAEFNRYFFYDAETGGLQERFIADACEDTQAFFPNFGGVILSDQSGQFAMGAYALGVKLRAMRLSTTGMKANWNTTSS